MAERMKIYVGVDGSEGAARALRWALEEARARDGELTAVMSWSYIDQHPMRGHNVFEPEYTSNTAHHALRQYVEDALRRCRWRINGRGNAAEVLGLHPNTLRNRMKKFGIQRPKGPVAFDPGRLSA